MWSLLLPPLDQGPAKRPRIDGPLMPLKTSYAARARVRSAEEWSKGAGTSEDTMHKNVSRESICGELQLLRKRVEITKAHNGSHEKTREHLRELLKRIQDLPPSDIYEFQKVDLDVPAE